MTPENKQDKPQPTVHVTGLYCAVQTVDKASWNFGNIANNQKQRKARALGGFDCRLFVRLHSISIFLKGF